MEVTSFHLPDRMPLERYRRIIPEWDRFRQVVQTEEPVTFRIRRARISADELDDRLSVQGFQIEPVASVPDFARVTRAPRSIGQTLEHWAGLLRVQQAVMGLPSLALEVHPGHRVLDLCSAPGGKTSHLAELMCETGPLVAVDPKEKRLRGLLGNLHRLGLTNVIVVAADGRRLPSEALFDRVLVDAPCSGEGNVRRQGGDVSPRAAGFGSYVTSLQEALLRRGIELTRPGGLVVYSTCTFAPEENELVLDRVIRDCPVSVEAIPLDASHCEGLTEWQGKRLHQELSNAWRVYPHQIDSGGLFMARLRRHGDGTVSEKERRSRSAETEAQSSPSGWSMIPAAFPGEDDLRADTRIETARHTLEDRFGVPRDELDSVGWMARGDHLWAHTAGSWPMDAWSEGGERGWRVVSVGLRALRRGPGQLETPSNLAVARWGRSMPETRRVILDNDGLRALLEDHARPCPELPRGPVALLYRGVVLGRGMVSKGGLVHELGKANARRLLEILSAERSG